MTQNPPDGRDFRDEQLRDSTFEHVDLSGSRFGRSTFRSNVKEALDTLLNEEWWHRQFAERDFTALEARLSTEAGTRHTEEKS